MTRFCPECTKGFEPDLPHKQVGAEPWQNEQHSVMGFCSDRCWDRHLGVRHAYTYDEKGRRFKDGERLLFAEAPL